MENDPKAVNDKISPLHMTLESIKELLLLLDIYPEPDKEKITTTSMEGKITMIRTLALATSYMNLGSTIIVGKNDCDEIIEYNLKSLNILIANLGENHPDVGSLYSKLGGAYFSKSNYDKSIEYNLKSLDILIARFGYNHPDVGSSYMSLGITYDRKGDSEKAAEYHLKSLSITYPRRMPLVPMQIEVDSKPKMCCFCFSAR